MGGLVFACIFSGCQRMELKEVRSKWKFGPEYKGDGDSNHERWTAQTGIEASWTNGWKTGIDYRGRYNSHADGYDKQDQGVWVDFSFPIWSAPSKPDKTKLLEDRIDKLERQISAKQSVSQ